MTALEDQIAVLEGAGIQLNPGITFADLLSETPRENYEDDPYLTLLTAMGENDTLSNDVWHFDTESIEGQGSYVAIAQRMAALSDGLLPLEQIEDEVDNDGISTGTAWLSFHLHGQPYKWELKIEDDWIDPDVFTLLLQLYDQQNPFRRYVLCSLGQDGLIACITPEQLQLLNEQTGLEFDWLT